MKVLGIGIGFQFLRRIGGLPACIRNATVAWWKDFNNIQDESTTIIINGLLDFDEINDYVSYSAHPDVSGNKTIRFKCAHTSLSDNSISFTFKNSNTDFFSFSLEAGGELTITVNNVELFISNITFSLNEILNFVIVKTTGGLTSVVVNDTVITMSSLGIGNNIDFQDVVGRQSRQSGISIEYYGGLIWDIQIDGIFASAGQPSGDENFAWDDSIGVVTATVNGTPSTTDLEFTTTSEFVEDSIGTRWSPVYYGQYLDSGSGQINLYRSSGTYDYTNPQDGTKITGNAIPGNGLISVPVSGMCEIETSDGSYYPLCERFGDVLHDISENEIHISVLTPSWSEELYGSDHLNQCGFIDKEMSDFMGYLWRTEVDSIFIDLDDDALIPIVSRTATECIDARGLTYPCGLILNKDLYLEQNSSPDFLSTDVPGGNIDENYIPTGDENIIIP